MSYKQLTAGERYQIYILKKEGVTQQGIAEALSRSPSTICREFDRNSGKRGYRPKQAQQRSDGRRQAAIKYKKLTVGVIYLIEQLIRQELSPEQISLYLNKERKTLIHHETIYRYIYRDKAKGGDLYTHLRIAAKPYRKRYGHYDRRGRIQEAVSIEQRPAIVDNRGRIGDWEGDTVMGKRRQSALLTLVERKTLYTLIVKLESKQAAPLAQAMIKLMKPHKSRVHTVTFDNGQEFSAHKTIERGLDTKVYFAHAYASWERGINENTNGLIRQYFPKGTDFSKVSAQEIQFVMDRLNNRPRKSRDARSPNEMFLGQSVDLLAA